MKRFLHNGILALACITLFAAEANADPYATPLHEAAASGDLIKVQELVRNGADVNGQGYYGSTPLSDALSNKQFAVAKYLLGLEKTDVNLATKIGATVLMLAAYEGNLELTTMIVKKGAKLNAVDSANRSALHWAKHANHQEVVSFLRSKGAK